MRYMSKFSIIFLSLFRLILRIFIFVTLFSIILIVTNPDDIDLQNKLKGEQMTVYRCSVYYENRILYSVYRVESIGISGKDNRTYVGVLTRFIRVAD